MIKIFTTTISDQNEIITETYSTEKIIVSLGLKE